MVLRRLNDIPVARETVGYHTSGGMVGESLMETWFSNIWKSSRKSISWEPEIPVLGVLAFEVSRLMSKVVNIWQSSLIDRLKKMERKVKKMEKFVAATEQMYSELEVLAELEQSLRRMRAGANLGKVKLLEFQQKVLWQRQEVKNLQDMSPWVRTYDYIVRLLLRSLFTIIERIKYVFGVNQIENVEIRNDFDHIHDDCLIRSNSMSSLLQTSRVPIGRSFSNLGFGAGCMTRGNESPVIETYTPSCGSSFRSNGASQKDADEIDDICTNIPIRHLLNAPPSSLGYAALALHYAKVIILIEKLASSPHLISLDARDDLYNMLPSTIRSCLRAKLKIFSRNLASSVYDAAFASEWSLAVARILEWLSPLAHNMVRWQSERNFERQRLVVGSNVLLVQTLYFANQEETEEAIVELLMGLNYLFRFGKEINENPFRESSCSRAYDGYLFPRDNMCYNMIDHSS
ncbi:hypothetical protein DH2020_026235 [Rehmannia glutinosa]|uniref:DUF668 domain-containing protein n=1 Tax=Rehmannia glutinosa TaxID=99300 RepID=A0ABR0VZC0_REHGL